MVKRGFDETATEHDLEKLATREQFQVVSDDLDLVRSDVRDIKITLGPLVRHVAAMEHLLYEHDKRIGRIERKIGMGK